MDIAPGARLGPYQILAPIGAGGMGEVYRARDTRLDRTVAIKVLPSQLAADPQLRERFDREARAISSLNHPHICTLFDVGHENGTDFLVLEYLEGETLAERLGRPEGRPLPAREALEIAIQIADALDKAHRAGIVHRDLKPANVFLVGRGAGRRGGSSDPPTAKLLDFGLAKSAAPVVTTSSLSMLPTTPPHMTAQGTILGTFQYMAPEQIEGLEADARTDIFAFGALLFEMLTGRTAFEGKTRASLLGAILKDDPPRVSSLQPVVPKALDRIISTCLAKDPDDRWQSARDLLHELKWVASGAAVESVAAPPAPRARDTRLAWAVASVLAIALVAATTIAVRHLRETRSAAEPLQFTIPVPENSRLGGPIGGGGTGTATQLAVSPDGRHVVFVATNQNTYMVWLRSVGALVARPIPGTEQASFPFWSPDSRFIGFFAGGKLKKVQLSGGPPIVLSDATNPRGGTWNRDNVIVFGATVSGGTGGGLQRVSSAGGTPSPATSLDAAYGDISHRWPHFLPDGRHFFFTAVTGPAGTTMKPSSIRVAVLGASQTTTLFEAESSIAYSLGHVFFWRDGTLMAQPFDVEARHVRGDAFPIAERVSAEGSRYAGFSLSETGVLVYGHSVRGATARLTWFDRTGRNLGTAAEPGGYMTLALSPDNRHVAVTQPSGTPENRDIWIIDVERGGSTRLTFEPGEDLFPVWSPDGSRIAFSGLRPAEVGIRQTHVGGTGNEELLLKSETNTGISPTDWSRDGHLIAYARATSGSGSDLWALPLGGDRKPFPLAQSAFTEDGGVFSPDGRWIAYWSTESGESQVYAQPVPPTGRKFLVSKGGGTQPMWRADGKEMFFVGPDGRMMAVPIDTTRSFEAGTEQPLFPTGIGLQFRRQYAVSNDGKRFLVNVVQQQASSLPLTVVVNWPATIQK